MRNGRVAMGLLLLLTGSATLASAALAAKPKSHQATPTSRLTISSDPAATVTIDGKPAGSTPALVVELAPGPHDLVLSAPGFVDEQRHVDLEAGEAALTVALHAVIATAHVTIAPEPFQPAHVRVDDREVGDAPWSGELTEGDHTVELESRTAVGPARKLTVRAGEEVKLLLPMSERPAVLSVNVADRGARVVIDETPRGSGGFRDQIPAGPHRLRVEQRGFEPYAISLDLQPGEISWIDVPALTPVAAYAATDATKQRRDRGFYGQVGLWGLVGPGANNDLYDGCPSGSSCSKLTAVGGALGLRFGYAFGWFGIEATAIGAADASGNRYKFSDATNPSKGAFYGPARTETYTVIRAGGGGGIGARVTAPFAVARPTLGVSGLVLGRSAQYVAAYTAPADAAHGVTPDAASHQSDAQGFVAPALAVDAGVLIGHSPGLKFHLGVVLLAEFDPTITADAFTSTLGTRIGTSGARAIPHGVPRVDLVNGTQLFVGPVLGVQFGY